MGTPKDLEWARTWTVSRSRRMTRTTRTPTTRTRSRTRTSRTPTTTLTTTCAVPKSQDWPGHARDAIQAAGTPGIVMVSPCIATKAALATSANTGMGLDLSAVETPRVVGWEMAGASARCTARDVASAKIRGDADDASLLSKRWKTKWL